MVKKNTIKLSESEIKEFREKWKVDEEEGFYREMLESQLEILANYDEYQEKLRKCEENDKKEEIRRKKIINRSRKLQNW